MDINYLLSRHQISVVQAERATCSGSRLAHEGRARLYLSELRAAGYSGSCGRQPG